MNNINALKKDKLFQLISRVLFRNRGLKGNRKQWVRATRAEISNYYRWYVTEKQVLFVIWAIKYERGDYENK